MPPPKKNAAPPRDTVPPCPPEFYTEPGNLVHHYSDLASDTAPALAIVQRVGQDAIDVMVVLPHNTSLYPFSGVHHRVAHADKADREGLWLPRPMDVAVLKYMIAQGVLEWDGESRYVEKKPKAEKEKEVPPVPPVTPLKPADA